MKHLKRNLLSMVLAVVMMLALCPAAFAAPVVSFDYDEVLFFEDFEGDTELNHELVAQNKEGLDNKVIAIGEDDNTNYVMSLNKDATSIGNYFRIRYNNTKWDDVVCLDEFYKDSPERLTQVKASMDVYLKDSFTKFNITGYDYINRSGTSAISEILVDFLDNTIKVDGDATNINVTPDTWYSIEITMNLVSDRYAVKISDGINEWEFKNKKLGTLNQSVQSFGIIVGNLKDDEYTIYADNMKFAVPSSNVNEYASDIAKIDFEETSEDYAVVTDEIGISAEDTQTYYTYEKFGKYPDKIRAEASIKRTEVGETAFYFGDTKIVSLGQDGLVSTDSSIGLSTDSEWTKVTLDMDFASGTFDVLMDGQEVAADAAIPAGITTPEEFKVGVENGGTLLVDYMKVSALAPYGSNKITGYLNDAGTFQYGYVVNNSTSETLKYNIIKAKFDKNNVFKSSTITPCTVDSNTMEIQHITPEFATDGDYYRYFMFDANTLEPLN